MHAVITPLFLNQKEAYRFRYQCEDCALFCEKSGLCIHGYPNKAHLKAEKIEAPGEQITFCKHFESV